MGLAVLMVALPLLGPSIDHHFAERQPYHAHLADYAWHEHTYQELARAPEPVGLPKADLVLYSFEISSAGPAVALFVDSELQRRLMPES